MDIIIWFCRAVTLILLHFEKFSVPAHLTMERQQCSAMVTRIMQ